MTRSSTRPSNTPSNTPSPRVYLGRRFAPFFITQFLGAFNDNLYKGALLVLITYGGLSSLGLDIDVLNNLAAGFLVLPFFLFAASAGQFADKFEKARIVRLIKVGELCIMLAAAAALLAQNTLALLALLFLTGTQSACFSPVKYAIIPQHLARHELVGGNALVQLGTAMAILLGLIAGSLVVQLPAGHLWLGGALVTIAAMGWLASQWIPPAPAADPDLPLHINPLRQMARTLRYATENRRVLWLILGISWYWFLGSIYLAQLPNYSRSVLGGNESLVTALLALFLLGIAVGALTCAKLARGGLGLRLVPVGGLGLAIFGADLMWAQVPAPVGELRTVGQFFAAPGSWRVVLDLLLVGAFGGFFVVPQAAALQYLAPLARRAQIVAANNVLNALLMVAAAAVGVLTLGPLAWSIPQLFFAASVATVIITALLWWRVLRHFAPGQVAA